MQTVLVANLGKEAMEVVTVVLEQAAVPMVFLEGMRYPDAQGNPLKDLVTLGVLRQAGGCLERPAKVEILVDLARSKVVETFTSPDIVVP